MKEDLEMAKQLIDQHLEEDDDRDYENINLDKFPLGKLLQITNKVHNLIGNEDGNHFRVDTRANAISDVVIYIDCDDRKLDYLDFGEEELIKKIESINYVKRCDRLSDEEAEGEGFIACDLAITADNSVWAI